MCTENIVRAFAGTLVLIGSLFAFFVNKDWLWLSTFAGLNLQQSSFTKFCPLEKILGHCHIGENKCAK